MIKNILMQIAVIMVCLGACARADVITHGGTTIDMGFQTIGHAGNMADSTGYGAVGYNYRIATYEVTVDKWNVAVSADANITNSTTWPPYGSGSKPADCVSWFEAARFCNWLTSGNALQGAYLFSGSNTLTGVNRSAAVSAYGMVYVLPTEDEWYKAAYYTGSGYSLYADGTDTVPSFDGWAYNGETWNVGSGYIEQNGTYDMMGNVYEWTESVYDSNDRVIRGGVLRREQSRIVVSYRGFSVSRKRRVWFSCRGDSRTGNSTAFRYRWIWCLAFTAEQSANIRVIMQNHMRQC